MTISQSAQQAARAERNEHESYLLGCPRLEEGHHVQALLDSTLAELTTHLAAAEKEKDVQRANADVLRTNFQRASAERDAAPNTKGTE